MISECGFELETIFAVIQKGYGGCSSDASDTICLKTNIVARTGRFEAKLRYLLSCFARKDSPKRRVTWKA